LASSTEEARRSGCLGSSLVDTLSIFGASAATLIIALVGAIVYALLWYLAEVKVAAIEVNEAALLADL
jgi:hypothetical protein